MADALSATDVRPLTDTVTIQEAEAIPYALHIQYTVDNEVDSKISEALDAAVAEYQEWQDNTVGRAFNPDRLIAKLYQAGVARVLYGAESNFGGGSVEYTTIPLTKRCKGTVTLAVMAP